jgi:thioredoxin 1
VKGSLILARNRRILSGEGSTTALSKEARHRFGARAAAVILLFAGNAPDVVLASGSLYDESADASSLVRAAVERADREDKRVLLEFGANWCGWCRELDRVFRNNPALARRLARDYVVVPVDVGRFDRNLALAGRYGVRNLDDTGIPILVVLDCRGDVVAVGDAGDFESATGDGYAAASVLRFLRANAAR